MSASENQSVATSIKMEKATFQSGDPIRILLTVTNLTKFNMKIEHLPDAEADSDLANIRLGRYTGRDIAEVKTNPWIAPIRSNSWMTEELSPRKSYIYKLDIRRWLVAQWPLPKGHYAVSVIWRPTEQQTNEVEFTIE